MTAPKGAKTVNGVRIFRGIDHTPPSTAQLAKRGTRLWEDCPLTINRMDFRAYEAEMAAAREVAPPPSPLNATPGVRVHEGWLAEWLTCPKKMKQKFDKAWHAPPPTSTWRVKGWG